jgi:hypothetical protein
MTGETYPRDVTAVMLAKADAAIIGVLLGPWAARALCAQADPEIFFPPAGDPGTEAKKICARCPVRQDCLAYALDADERFGIWGGLDPDERRNLHRRQNRRSSAKPDASRGAA